MKTLIIIVLSFVTIILPAQNDDQLIINLVDQYNNARVATDAGLLKQILVDDIDQLVSTGEWRRGLEASMAGMMRSSTRQPGSRSLTVEKVRFLTSETAIADARYVIDNDDGTQRKMCSTFVAVQEDGIWKIAAIRNMLPTE